MAAEQQTHTGITELATLSAVIFFGASVVATRFVVDETGAVTLAFLRFSIGTLCILSLAFVTRAGGVKRADMPATFALGALFFGIFPWLFSQSLLFIPASLGAIILATMPILTLIVAALVGSEALTKEKLLGTGLGFLGVSIAVAAPDSFSSIPLENLLLGALLMLATSLCGALYNVLSRSYLQRNNSVAFTALAMLSGTIFLLPFAAGTALTEGWPSVSWAGLMAILFLGTLGGGIGFFLWTWALQRTTPTRVAIFVTINPIAAIILAALLLGEPFQPVVAVGLAFVLIGILVVSLPGRS